MAAWAVWGPTSFLLWWRTLTRKAAEVIRLFRTPPPHGTRDAERRSSVVGGAVRDPEHRDALGVYFDLSDEYAVRDESGGESNVLGKGFVSVVCLKWHEGYMAALEPRGVQPRPGRALDQAAAAGPLQNGIQQGVESPPACRRCSAL